MLLAGLGIGALASQLGAVTVSAVPDEQSGEVGGLQNTVTNLGASIGTALAGAVLISALTGSFIAGIQDNPGIPRRGQVKRAGRTGERHSLHLRHRPAQSTRGCRGASCRPPTQSSTKTNNPGSTAYEPHFRSWRYSPYLPSSSPPEYQPVNPARRPRPAATPER